VPQATKATPAGRTQQATNTKISNTKNKKVNRKNDFIWSEYEEPHCSRKKEILQKHGKDLNKLMGIEPRTKYLTVGVVALHILSAYLFCNLSWPYFLLSTFVVGGTLTHILFLAIHEITHGLAFKKPIYNDFLAMVANFPICIPYAMVFKTYHAEHHRYQGWDGIDTDIPTPIEGFLFSSTPGKIFFAMFQIMFYALRPCLVRSINFTWIRVVNTVVQLVFDYIIYRTLGLNALLYFLVSAFMSACPHPLSGHFISEHYVFDPNEEQETYSYYGPLNALTWNVGYHNEHHDFPNVAWSKLPQLKKLASEFYDPLIQTESWPGTIYNFIVDPRVSTWSRVKREKEAWKRDKLLPTTIATR
jgi:sphingolipid delta-4 desaturase